jgi:hypothetical protein
MTQFRTVQPGSTDVRTTQEIIRGIMDGKTNNTGTITLADNGATTTALYDERIGYDSVILFAPESTAAFEDSAPYGAFQDTTDQAATSLGQATIMSFNATDYSNGVTLSNSTRLNVSTEGIYDLQFSAQFKNTTNDSQHVDIWFRKNGTDVSSSNSRFGMPARKSTGDPSHLIAGLNFFFDLNVNDYIEIAWRPSDLGVSLEHFAAVSAVAGSTPDIPETPSLIATMEYIAPNPLSNVYTESQSPGYAVLKHFANYATTTSPKTYSYVIIG